MAIAGNIERQEVGIGQSVCHLREDLTHDAVIFKARVHMVFHIVKCVILSMVGWIVERLKQTKPQCQYICHKTMYVNHNCLHMNPLGSFI